MNRRDNSLTVTVLPSGDLQLAAGNRTRSDIKEMQAHHDSLSILADLLEPYWTNGSFEPFDSGEANPFVGLTTAPCIAEALDTHDEGQREIVGRFWYFPNYMIRDPMDDLKEHGRVIFSLAT